MIEILKLVVSWFVRVLPGPDLTSKDRPDLISLAESASKVANKAMEQMLTQQKHQTELWESHHELQRRVAELESAERRCLQRLAAVQAKLDVLDAKQ
jgi:hypothetical protein